MSVLEVNNLECFPGANDGVPVIKQSIQSHIADESSECFEVDTFLFANDVLGESKAVVAHESVHDMKMVILNVELIMHDDSLKTVLKKNIDLSGIIFTELFDAVIDYRIFC